MPIKNSSLEQKWYYRVAKVFFSILPILVAVMALFTGYVKLEGLSQKNIPAILQKNSDYIIYAVVGVVLYYLILNVIWRTFLYIVFGGLEDDTAKNGSKEIQSVNPTALLAPIILILIAVAVYVLFQNGYIKLPQIDPYIGKSIPAKTHTYGASCTNSEGKTGLYGTNGVCYTCSSGNTAVTNPTNNNCSNGSAGVYCCSTTGGNNGGKKTEGCIPTGCGTLWRCSGTYYVGGKQISVNGLCFPSGMRPTDIYSSWTGTCRQCP